MAPPKHNIPCYSASSAEKLGVQKVLGIHSTHILKCLKAGVLWKWLPVCMFLLGVHIHLHAPILSSFCSQEGERPSCALDPLSHLLSPLMSQGHNKKKKTWYESTHKQTHLEESLFLVSKVLFSDCETTFTIGLQVTWKQSLDSMEESLKNLHKWLWLLTYSLCTFYNSVHLGEVLFRMCMLSKYWVCSKRLEGQQCFCRVSLSVCQLAAGVGCQCTRSTGSLWEQLQCFEGFCAVINFSFACYSLLPLIFANRLFRCKSVTATLL